MLFRLGEFKIQRRNIKKAKAPFLCYEVEFESGGMAYSYEINAATGAILKHETGLDD